ncbi:chromatin-remodeling ATPase INO80-like [Anabrus simplex]|uniref:chromatin-remodeling ATPase INO80-like n=1 Tax=Anabrus simplex TaxID=316456 RepID=UPI0035A381FB
MTQNYEVSDSGERLKQTLYRQRLKQSLSLEPFLSHVEHIFSSSTSDEENVSGSESGEVDDVGRREKTKGFESYKKEIKYNPSHLYSFTAENEWLREVLLSESSEASDDDEEEDTITYQHLQSMLRLHYIMKKSKEKYATNPNKSQYLYYSTRILSPYGNFSEQEKWIQASHVNENITHMETKSPRNRRTKYCNENVLLDSECNVNHMEDGIHNENDKYYPVVLTENIPVSSENNMLKKHKQIWSPEMMSLYRRELWVAMANKEIRKYRRAKIYNQKETQTTRKRLSLYCVRFCRRKAMQSQKSMRESTWRSKRLTREMLIFWKRRNKMERDARRRLQKEAEEKRKRDSELTQSKQQQGKFNFLMARTELFAHFMAKRLGESNFPEEKLSNCEFQDGEISETATMTEHHNRLMKENTFEKRNFDFEQTDAPLFAHQDNDVTPTKPVKIVHHERPQPSIFKGSLKHYQLKGMNWLADLYDQGINGILADEMGLGKTVQTIAFLCLIAEVYNAWGPFLVVAPASVLHNWQQEMARFVPDFKIIPYWGSPLERKFLRRSWNHGNLHSKEASFHVVITSYRIVITDFKYLNRTKWQYMVLDEAQALKSTNSIRWKLLLGFRCRNRLLISGTPIQNSMAELWSLLHFIMPTLFDSHDEFNEWFAKDIENHTENKTEISETHLSRLHMILKPFMLRRTKKDVENELSDKIEIIIYCPFMARQKLMYSALKKNIRIEDMSSCSQRYEGVAPSLMNLVMQFRKVCNHPDLFERREARSPLYFVLEDFLVSRFVIRDGLLSHCERSKHHWLYNALNIFAVDYIHRTLFPADELEGNICSRESCFSFTRFCNISPEECSRIALGGLLGMWVDCQKLYYSLSHIHHRRTWWDDCPLALHLRYLLIVTPDHILSPFSREKSQVLSWMVFTAMTSNESSVYAHNKHIHYSIAETMEHRIHRSRKMFSAKSLNTNERSLILWKMQNNNFSKGVINSVKGISANAARISPQGSKVDMLPKGFENLNSTKLGTPGFCQSSPKKIRVNNSCLVKYPILQEFHHVRRPPEILECERTDMPSFLQCVIPRVQCCAEKLLYGFPASMFFARSCTERIYRDDWKTLWFGSPEVAERYQKKYQYHHTTTVGGLEIAKPRHGWFNIIMPRKETLITDSGKLYVLDGLLKRLKEQGHRALIYSQMTRMIDLLEEYMWYRKYTYMRLDGSSKISERKDIVSSFQSREDIFVFLLSTRAGGLGINLTAADTVIFYDSDWNPSVDQQAMDRVHRLGQTKQVTVYRLVCKDSIEDRILQRAKEKSEMQHIVISKGNFKPDTLKQKEVMYFLFDDDSEKYCSQRRAVMNKFNENGSHISGENEHTFKRKLFLDSTSNSVKRVKLENKMKHSVSSCKESDSHIPSFSSFSKTSSLDKSCKKNSTGILNSENPFPSSSKHIRGSRRGRGFRRRNFTDWNSVDYKEQQNFCSTDTTDTISTSNECRTQLTSLSDPVIRDSLSSPRSSREHASPEVFRQNFSPSNEDHSSSQH